MLHLHIPMAYHPRSVCFREGLVWFNVGNEAVLSMGDCGDCMRFVNLTRGCWRHEIEMRL